MTRSQTFTMYRHINSAFLFTFSNFLYCTHAGISTINTVTYSGNGCAQGTVYTTKDPHSTILTQDFEGLFLSWGPGTNPVDHLKTCVININFGFDEPCNRLTVNKHGMNATGFLYRMRENVAIKAIVTYMRADGVDAVASSTVSWEDLPVDPISGWLGWQHTSGAPDNTITTSCSDTTWLRIYYRVTVTTSEEFYHSLIGSEGPQEGNWSFKHSISVEKCEGCEKG
ncbi:hypothetical protein BKA66DRAFT_468886 [Pyrenochaeta sp. MPI-SDFR-AT-0127]|nr:hypothetical protein BKA66DRAFT_468886 [Pyrenochaeta sp. MPI-SDFR-AT-0127]